LRGPTTHRLDVSHEKYTPLTRQALLQHNIKHTSPDGDKMRKLSPTNLEHAVVHTCILTADDHVAQKRHLYHRQHRQLYTPATPLPEHEQHIELGSRYLDQPIEYPCLHPYPTVTQQGDINHQTGNHPTGQDKFERQETVPVKQEPYQAWNSCGNSLAGIGAQFMG
jgi:hypothetical protein